MTQPEALRLAEQLEAIGLHGPVAAELRRLHAELERCKQVCAATSECWRFEAKHLEAQRDALLEALKKYVYLHDGDCECGDCAAIAKAEGEKT